MESMDSKLTRQDSETLKTTRNNLLAATDYGFSFAGHHPPYESEYIQLYHSFMQELEQSLKRRK